MKVKPGYRDASLEEVFHLISAKGISPYYPSTDAEEYQSFKLSEAVDIARGGYFDTIPASYTTSAFYTYDYLTCDYNC